ELIATLALDNPKVPSNMLNAIGNVRQSQLMDENLWNYKDLESELIPYPGPRQEPKKQARLNMVGVKLESG
ncbi:MAG: hypothetical protein AMJ68_02545, partial [Acidithiobacillales bacterium SG8_45]